MEIKSSDPQAFGDRIRRSMDEQEKATTKRNMHVLEMLVIALLTTPLDGWVVSIMWRWFVVPMGAHPIGVMHATGLMVLPVLLIAKRPRKSLQFTVEEVLSAEFITPFTILLTAWIIKLMAF